ncbi:MULTISPECIES: cytidylyltransferase domain-containing protein [Pseudoalteromonas]|uniref:Glycosyltransferase family protein n=1 Tax=Pseudoalteromonas maricaloris TaxID=184924 RepID=A0A8I2H3X0_9GAMM|nr:MULTISPECIES: glycosyltransferase family protein [Pseudoalteromonas]MBD0782652.1 NTP transferase domain-containing protein [Pseudoalteromonas flavipulchra]MCG7538575.1 glycosyltransferase family protein [Pseudoalteromonas sp. OF7H-1]MCG9767420.1 glycosyltransferase family protein [Pseudoalteromonas piscicida]NLR20619.1 NTP transferase domain-containing protein [Pseudoalteromonas maricaloris]QUI63007.1 NTP transferase domain-containing protein [Pseudoalteromonas sp. A22]
MNQSDSIYESLKNKDFHIIIQARMTSTRLPKKVMLPLCGRPVLQVMIERLSPFKDKIIVATTNDGSQTPITELCKSLGVRFVEGDTHDVLSRYYLAAELVNAKPDTVLVRCTSDCPLIDAYETAKVVSHFFNIRNNFDYVCAGPHCGFPNGLDTEVFTFAALAQAHASASQDFEREHLTQYIVKNLKVADYSYHEDLSGWRLTLDEPDDYLAIQKVFQLFDNKTEFSFPELKRKLKAHPEVLDINKHVEQVKVG